MAENITKIDANTVEIRVPEVVTHVALDVFQATYTDKINGFLERITQLTANRDSYDILISAATKELDTLIEQLESVS